MSFSLYSNEVRQIVIHEELRLIRELSRDINGKLYICTFIKADHDHPLYTQIHPHVFTCVLKVIYALLFPGKLQ